MDCIVLSSSLNLSSMTPTFWTASTDPSCPNSANSGLTMPRVHQSVTKRLTVQPLVLSSILSQRLLLPGTLITSYKLISLPTVTILCSRCYGTTAMMYAVTQDASRTYSTMMPHRFVAYWHQSLTQCLSVLLHCWIATNPQTWRCFCVSPVNSCPFSWQPVFSHLTSLAPFWKPHYLQPNMWPFLKLKTTYNY